MGALIWGQYEDDNDCRWRGRYKGSESDPYKWTVQMYRVQTDGLEIGVAWWQVYGEDMEIIYCHEHDAQRIKSIIEDLST